MAKAKQEQKKSPAKVEKTKAMFALGPQNYKLMLIGFGIIVLGFILMSGGKSPDPAVFSGDELYSFRRITLAPIVVMAGFVFEIYAIMKRPKKVEE